MRAHIYELNDDAYVHAAEGEDPHICKIVEMFEGIDGKLYYAAQWFYRVPDTVIGTQEEVKLSKKRVFFSNVIDANELITLVKKLNILMITLNENTEETIVAMTNFDYYCDMTYHLHYSTFEALKPNKLLLYQMIKKVLKLHELKEQKRHCWTCIVAVVPCVRACAWVHTAQQAGLKLVTKWAVDLNKYACESLKYNHKETRVRNESAEDFLSLLKEWEKLCIHFSLRECQNPEKYVNLYGMTSDEDDEDRGEECDNKDVFTVKKIIGISFGNPETKKARKTKKSKTKIEKPGLYLKVRWLGYTKDDDTWEPIEGLSNCRERIKAFVKKGYKSSILPLPVGVDVVCGGPPCQGISGFNRFRNSENPLEDEKNKQLLVYMDIVKFLKPKYTLMENVVDILKFAECSLARYAVGRLVQMNYQSRMGLMAAGAYGLAQFRMRFFLWGALYRGKMLPQFPLPTHDLVMRGYIPKDFENNVVAYNEGHTVKLGEKLFLADVISDLPAVTNDETREAMPYDKDPITEFQKFIRLGREELPGSGSVTKSKSKKPILYDHHPLNLNTGDSKRVSYVPKKKKGNFRDFPGLIGSNKIVEFDPDLPKIYLDEFNTPLGFPDYYKLFGPTREKYTQVGNAVAVPVARALGYALGLAFQGFTDGSNPLLALPEGFPNLRNNLPKESSQ
ncbi:DNA (cytosine-5)-methyltransferase CMT3 [Cardamine amara subsp. amara]|uniref:DNA (cytosine-5-)-methyltransferase n=1 Tax=Cardamine amara subsp. amara TaxID=228776 RepID=A0ABD1BFS9_CARAN